MVFSDSSGKQGIVEHIDFRAGTNGTSYPIADKTRNINRWYYRVVTAIDRASGRAQRNDSNLAALPKVDLNMVNGTHEVLLPDTNRKINAIEVKDSAGIWYRLQEIDFSDQPNTISSFTTTSGKPIWYNLIGAHIYLEPAPATASVTLTAGLRVWTSPEVDVFVVSDTTQEPGFVEDFHEILALGPAWDYIIINGTAEEADRLRQEITLMFKDLATFYRDRNQDTRVAFRPAHRTQDYL